MLGNIDQSDREAVGARAKEQPSGAAFPASDLSNSAELAVSAVITNFNGKGSLEKTLASLSEAHHGFAEIILVDDGSTDGSREWAEANYPDVRVIALGRNTANLGIVRNAGITAARTPYVFLVDNDIVVYPGCVAQLLATIRADRSVVSVTPRLLDQDRPDVIYQSGNHLHFLGVSTGSGRGRLLSETPGDAPVQSIGGGIMMLDKGKLGTLGNFDSGYTLGWSDDGEMHLRAILAGYKSLHDPRAICLVEVREHGTKRAYGQFHNRLRLILTTYGRGTLIGLAPALILFEIAVFLASLASGSSSAYFRAVRDTWRERANVRAARATIQTTRTVSDREVLRRGSFEAPGLSKLGAGSRSTLATLQVGVGVFWWVGYPFIT